MNDKIKCSTCDGTGEIPLKGKYAETLKIARKRCNRLRRGGYVFAWRDHEWFGCKPTALNNRLAWLEEHGFLRSERVGRQRRFYLVEA